MFRVYYLLDLYHDADRGNSVHEQSLQIRLQNNLLTKRIKPIIKGNYTKFHGKDSNRILKFKVRSVTSPQIYTYDRGRECQIVFFLRGADPYGNNDITELHLGKIDYQFDIIEMVALSYKKIQEVFKYNHITKFDKHFTNNSFTSSLYV